MGADENYDAMGKFFLEMYVVTEKPKKQKKSKSIG